MLTETKIAKALKNAPADGELILSDGGGGRGTGALQLRIRGGRGIWRAGWKRDGKRAFKVLGRYPTVSLAQAREAYKTEIAPALEAGKDPRTHVAVTGSPTVGRMFQAYVDTLKARGMVCWPETERALLKAKDNAADALGRNKLAGAIEPGDVAAYLATFFKRGKRGAADKHRTYIAGAYNWAIKSTHDYTSAKREDWGVKGNPATAVKRDMGAKRDRDRNLTAGEIATLWKAADQSTPMWSMETAACVRLLILCGQRVQETLRLEGREIDLDTGLWIMPREKTKGKKRAHTIPLGPLAIAVLEPLLEQYGEGPLFPSRAGSAGRYIDHRSIMTVIDRWNTGKIPHFQSRDLRRTWKSRTGEIGISREIRDIIQQHSRQDIGSRAYDRADYLPQMRAAMDRWEAWLASVVE